MTNKYCLHGCDVSDAKGAACKTCGWHLAEHQRRLWLIRHGRLKPAKTDAGGRSSKEQRGPTSDGLAVWDTLSLI